MADAEADRGTQPTAPPDPDPDGPEPEADAPRPGRRPWPLAAVCAVALSTALVVLLLVMSLLGIRLGGGPYDPDVGGSVAEWLEAIATLVAVPIAVFVGVRQLRSTTEELALVRRRLAVEEVDRAERLRADLALLRHSVRARTCAANVVDHVELATERERGAVERWREECRLRGWVPDAEARGWSRGGQTRSNAELLVLESSPLVRRPWFGAVECVNTGMATVELRRWTVVLDGTSTTTGAAVLLGAGSVVRRRLGTDAGLQPAYARPGDVEARLATVTVVVHGFDAADHPLQIVASRE